MIVAPADQPTVLAKPEIMVVPTIAGRAAAPSSRPMVAKAAS